MSVTEQFHDKKTTPYRMQWPIATAGYACIDEVVVTDPREPLSLDWVARERSNSLKAPDLRMWSEGRGLKYNQGPWLVETHLLVPNLLYDPMEQRTLHRQFSALAKDGEAVLDFASKFGSLGAHYFLSLKPGEGQILDHAESLQFWFDHIECMCALLKLLEYSRDEDLAKQQLFQLIKETLTQYDEILSKKDGAKASLYLSRRLISRKAASYLWRHLLPTQSGSALSLEFKYSVFARQILEFRLNGLLGSLVAPTLDVDANSGILLRPKNLLGALYSLFAEEVMGANRPMKKCPGCGKWIQPLDPRKKTCSDICRQRAYRNRAKNSNKENENV